MGKELVKQLETVPMTAAKKILRYSSTTITGNHSKQDQILLVKIAKYVGFCVRRRSYLIWPPVIVKYSSLKAELRMYPLETNRDTRKLKWQYRVK